MFALFIMGSLIDRYHYYVKMYIVLGSDKIQHSAKYKRASAVPIERIDS